ncbi:hypothetical protein C7212DRAFT_313834, partial [Tuber magnatum]
SKSQESESHHFRLYSDTFIFYSVIFLTFFQLPLCGWLDYGCPETFPYKCR